MPTAAIYTRVSTAGQAEKGFSLDAQEKIGRELCERNKWQHKVFTESGRSAAKETLDNRPQLEAILDLIEDGKIQYLFVTELDRLSRNPITLAYIKKTLSENDVKVVTPSQTFDFRDDEDDFLSDLLGILAKRENRQRVKRSKRAKLEAAKLGRWVGSTLPFGFMKLPCIGDRLRHNQLVPHPEESKLYLQIVDWSLRGLGSNTIARKLNEMSIPTRLTSSKRSYIWKANVVLRILNNPVYKGIYKYGESRAEVKGIISPERWQSLQDNLRRNYNNAWRNTKRFYLLKGLLVCGRCGRRLYGMIKPSDGMRCYCCLSKRPDPTPRFCGLKNVPLDKINNEAWDITRRVVSNSSEVKRAIQKQHAKNDSAEDTVKADIKRVERELAAVRVQADRMLDLYAKGNMPEDDIERKILELKGRREKLATEKSDLEKKLAWTEHEQQNLDYIEKYLATIRKRIDSFTDQDKYELLHLIIERIVIHYDAKTNTHKFDIDFVIPLQEVEENEDGGSSTHSNTVSNMTVLQSAVRFTISGSVPSGFNFCPWEKST